MPTADIFEDDRPPRFAHRGRTFVYVLPCAGEDILKVGFSAAPLNRLRTLHPRFFDFFDLDRSFLIETDYLRDAKRIERMFITALFEHQAPSPLVVKRSAAGHTEWYRRAYPEAAALGHAISSEEALVMHTPLRSWLSVYLGERLDLLYQWSSDVLNAIEFAQQNGAPDVARHYTAALRNVMDAYSAVGLTIADHMPRHVFTWYRSRT